MDLRAHSFRCFLLLAEEANFTRAAVRAGLTQSALSMRIRDMERQLGVPLFHRSSRSVVLTSEGAEMLDQVRRIVAETDRFQALAADLRSAPEAPITVALPITAAGTDMWMRMIDGFRALEPHTEIRMVRHITPDIVAAVAEAKAEVGFVAGNPLASLPTVVLERRRVSIAVPNEWALAGRLCLSRADLIGLRIAAFDRAINPGLFDQTLARLGDAGAELVYAREGIIAAGFAARERIASLAFQGTHGPDPSAQMTVLEWADEELLLDLCALRTPATTRRSVRRFWEMIRQRGLEAIDARSSG